MRSVIAIAVFALSQSASVYGHASILGVYGSNAKVGLGFGVDRYGLFDRLGIKSDAGGDVSIFDAGVDMPQPPCGSSPWLGGAIDSGSWLNQAEGFGVPAAAANGSITFTLYQVNADGGGPAKCEYCSDASLSDSCWKPMNMLVNQPGKDGVLFVKFTNHTLVAEFPADAMCTGGIYGDTCVARCRTGTNSRTRQQYRFGGCFAVRLAAHVRPNTVTPKRNKAISQHHRHHHIG